MGEEFAQSFKYALNSHGTVQHPYIAPVLKTRINLNLLESILFWSKIFMTNFLPRQTLNISLKMRRQQKADIE